MPQASFTSAYLLLDNKPNAIRRPHLARHTGKSFGEAFRGSLDPSLLEPFFYRIPLPRLRWKRSLPLPPPRILRDIRASDFLSPARALRPVLSAQLCRPLFCCAGAAPTRAHAAEKSTGRRSEAHQPHRVGAAILNWCRPVRPRSPAGCGRPSSAVLAFEYGLPGPQQRSIRSSAGQSALLPACFLRFSPPIAVSVVPR